MGRRHLTREQEKAMFARMNPNRIAPSYTVVKRNTSNKQYLYGDFDRDKTPNLDDKEPMNPNVTEQVADFKMSKDFKDIEKTTLERRKSLLKVNKHFKAQGYETIYRTKSLYSTLNKLKRKHLPQIHDLGGMTIFIKNENEAYKAAEDVEHNYKVIEREDYYKNPKPSGYKAIHYIIEEDGKPIEVKIQTKKDFYASQKTHKLWKEGKIDV